MRQFPLIGVLMLAFIAGCGADDAGPSAEGSRKGPAAQPPSPGQIVANGYQNASLGMALGFGSDWEPLSGMVAVDTLHASGGFFVSAGDGGNVTARLGSPGDPAVSLLHIRNGGAAFDIAYRALDVGPFGQTLDPPAANARDLGDRGIVLQSNMIGEWSEVEAARDVVVAGRTMVRHDSEFRTATTSVRVAHLIFIEQDHGIVISITGKGSRAFARAEALLQSMAFSD